MDLRKHVSWGVHLTIALTVAASVAAAIPRPATAELVAPRSACSGQGAKASKHRQQRGLRCMINYARAQAGADGLHSNRKLERAAARKARDIEACGFSHTACGRDSAYWPRQVGYVSGGSWGFGENLGWGSGRRGSPRRMVKAWLASSGHRGVMLGGSFDHLGIGLRSHGRRNIWVLQVGCHSC
jgi:uncharacterized protein YkwD